MWIFSIEYGKQLLHESLLVPVPTACALVHPQDQVLDLKLLPHKEKKHKEMFRICFINQLECRSLFLFLAAPFFISHPQIYNFVLYFQIPNDILFQLQFVKNESHFIHSFVANKDDYYAIEPKEAPIFAASAPIDAIPTTRIGGGNRGGGGGGYHDTFVTGKSVFYSKRDI